MVYTSNRVLFSQKRKGNGRDWAFAYWLRRLGPQHGGTGISTWVQDLWARLPANTDPRSSRWRRQHLVHCHPLGDLGWVATPGFSLASPSHCGHLGRASSESRALSLSLYLSHICCLTQIWTRSFSFGGVFHYFTTLQMDWTLLNSIHLNMVKMVYFVGFLFFFLQNYAKK